VDLPARGFVFWPVGCGDSTTVKVNDNVIMQVDIHHMTQSDDDEIPYAPVVDRLMDILPEVDGVKYLAVFALTHADKDHCKGFKLLLEKVEAGELRIGELWFTPRILRDYSEHEELSEDAQAFCEEAMRRVEAISGKDEDEVSSGDRVLVIGNDDILDEDDFKDLADRFRRRPGEEVTVLDGAHLDGTFRTFLHAPFGDDSTCERNKTSLGMQVTLWDGDASGRAMLLGDLDYPPLRRIFVEYSEDADKAWDVLLAPHHCSKSAMYFQDEGDDEPVLKQDVLDAMDAAAGETGWVIASSVPVPAVTQPGDNPPHAKAKARYEGIAPSGFLCTGEYPAEDTDDPIIFSVDADGLTLFSGEPPAEESQVSAAVTAARGGPEPHGSAVGFGRC
jgi:hypothetical protein